MGVGVGVFGVYFLIKWFWTFLDLFKCDISEIKKVEMINERVTTILRLIRKWAWAFTLILKNVREKVEKGSAKNLKKGTTIMKKCEKVAWLLKVKLVTDLDLKKSWSWVWFFLDRWKCLRLIFCKKLTLKNCLLNEKKRRALKS